MKTINEIYEEIKKLANIAKDNAKYYYNLRNNATTKTKEAFAIDNSRECTEIGEFTAYCCILHLIEESGVLEEQKVKDKMLEQQLIEKEEEIGKLTRILMATKYKDSISAQTRPYKELEGKSLYEISQIYQNQVRKQICDEIRNAIDNEEYELWGENSRILSIHADKFNAILNQIEKGEE